MANDLAGNIYVLGDFAGGIEALAGTLPALEGLFERDYGGEMDATIPALVGEITEKLNTAGIFDLSLPGVEGSFLYGGYLDVEISALTGEITYDFDTSGSFLCSLPMIQFSMTGISGVLGTLVGVIPSIRFSGSGYSYGTNTLAGIIPAITFIGFGVSGTYRCIVVNLYNGSITEYSNFEFDSFTKLGDTFYGAKGTGIYSLGGATDTGSAISATLKPFLTNLGVAELKNLKSALISFKSAGNLTITPLYENYTGTAGTIIGEDGKLHMKRTKFGRGKRGQFVGAQVQNVAGADFGLDAMIYDIDVMLRRLNE